MLYLQNHPQLRTSEDMIGWPQESRYFSAAHDPEAAGRNWRFYLRKYPPATDGVLTFDKSPNYLLNPKIPSVLASLMPSLKLLVCLRNPTSRAYSHLQHECRNGRVRQSEGAVFRSKSNDESSERLSFPCAPEAFDRLVKAQLAAKGDMNKCEWARGSGSGDSNVLPRGFYDCQLAPWFDRFPRSQLLALVFEDFVSSREATLEAVARVERFAGLEPFDYGRSARVAAVERLYALMPSRGGRYAPMLAATRGALDELYCSPNRALSATLRRPLPWPCGGGAEPRSTRSPSPTPSARAPRSTSGGRRSSAANAVRFRGLERTTKLVRERESGEGPVLVAHCVVITVERLQQPRLEGLLQAVRRQAPRLERGLEFGDLHLLDLGRRQRVGHLLVSGSGVGVGSISGSLSLSVQFLLLVYLYVARPSELRPLLPPLLGRADVVDRPPSHILLVG